MTDKFKDAEKWVVDQLKRLYPAETNPTVIEVTRVPATVEERALYTEKGSEKEWPFAQKVVPPEIPAIRSDDAVLLRKSGYPAIPDQVQAYNDYCALDADKQRDLILRLLETAKDEQNQAAWDAASDLIARMTENFNDWGVEHPHYRDLKFVRDHHHPRPKPGKRRSKPTADQRKALIIHLVTTLIRKFDVQASHNPANNHDCACAIVARACAAHFQDKLFTETAAHTAYYRSRKPSFHCF